MVAVPAPTPVTNPELLTVATPTSELTHGFELAATSIDDSCTVSSTQTLAPPVIVGSELTVTTTSSVATQPFASVPVTVYVAVDVGVNAVPLVTPLSHT